MQTPPDQQPVIERIRKRFDSADKGVHRRARDRWDHFYALYHNYTEFKNGLGVDRRDRDAGLRSAQREWGAELFIPFSFSTVETVVARALAGSPRVIVKPRRQRDESNAPNMKLIVDSQLSNIDYEMTLQDIAREAFILGTGVQKTYWNTKRRDMPGLQQSVTGSGEWVSVSQNRTLFDDPVIERVDPYDWFWDPFAASVQECDWIIHRTWRSTEYCKRLLEQGIWTFPESEQLQTELTQGMSGAGKYTEAWSQRMKIDGYPDFRSPDIHEVWEYHDGNEVITVLNRELVVQQGPNPAWHGEFPFQVYRPTRKAGQMAGKGEIEPIEDLQQEINTLRSQRRDNATIVLQRAYAYADGLIDPSDFKIGPGVGIPTLGDPREVLFPLPIADIPNSGYQEESALMADIMRTSGVDDTANGSGSVQQTATGTQLVYQAQGARIKQKTRGLEVELVRSAGRQVMSLNQQKILTNRDIRIPSPPQPGRPDCRWAWSQVGPAELAGEFELDVDGGTMAPENVPQQRQDAQTWLGLASSGQVDQRMAMLQALHNLGIDDPESMLPQPVPQVPAEAVDHMLQIIGQATGASPAVLGQAKAAALQPPEKK